MTIHALVSNCTPTSGSYELANHTAGRAPVHGGTGIDGLTRHLVLEELGWGSGLAAGLGVAALPFEFTAMLAEMTGNHRLLDEIVAPFVADREARYIGCWAITEPSHGSDALDAGTDAFTRARAAGSCRAMADGDEWVITGEKAAWVSNGSIAPMPCCSARWRRRRGRPEVGWP